MWWLILQTTGAKQQATDFSHALYLKGIMEELDAELVAEGEAEAFLPKIVWIDEKEECP